MAYTIQIGRRQFFGLRGNLHVHSNLSDGTKSREELARIAEEAGLDFIIVTDHNTYQPGLDGWLGNTLLLTGEEVHDCQRHPESSHTLCFDAGDDVAEAAFDPQAVIDAVAARGGCTFLAHPFERDAADFVQEPNISWRDWQVDGYAGIEIWNTMSEFKSALRTTAHAILYAYLPALAISGPYHETLHKWDELLRARRVSALGGSDAHGRTYRWGPLSREVLPYDLLFRCVNTHLLSQQPLAGPPSFGHSGSSLKADKAIIYAALRAGHGFLGYERPGAIAGFAFWARSRDAEAIPGETLSMAGAVELRMTTPGRARLRLLRDGQVIAQTHGDRLALIAHRPGVYRVEAYRSYAGRERGWIFSNPIYVC
jgi:hypothetical protein